MIEQTHTTNKEPRLGRKTYFLVMVSNEPVGISTTYSVAKEYLSNLAKEYDAKPIDTDVYSIGDSYDNLMTIKEVTRIKG